MREIEFRAKCQLKGKWMYGYYRVSGGKHYINSTLIYPETVGQFTGLKDKNGQKIYEGDICKMAWSRLDGETAYSTIVIKNPFDYSLDEIAWINHSHEIVIIGNNHDIPKGHSW